MLKFVIFFTLHTGECSRSTYRVAPHLHAARLPSTPSTASLPSSSSLAWEYLWLRASAGYAYLSPGGDRTNSGNLSIAWHPYSVTYCGSTCWFSLLTDHCLLACASYALPVRLQDQVRVRARHPRHPRLGAAPARARVPLRHHDFGRSRADLAVPAAALFLISPPA